MKQAHPLLRVALATVAAVALAAAAAVTAPVAHADVITDWNAKAGDIVNEARPGTPPANRMMAILYTATFEAVNAITRRYPQQRTLALDVPADASVDAAVAATHRVVLTKGLPQQQAAIDAAYQAALAKIADGAGKTAGIALGEKAAAAVLDARASDGAATPESYRPHTSAGTYVPTVIPAVSQWPQRKPWLMTSASQFRPGPPPALTSAVWARDFNEIKALGGKASSKRSAEQTEIARFWETSLPTVYHGIVRSVASMPGREVTRNARLFAAVTQAQDDALIAVFDAKYSYNFWRPVTAIRNADIDGNDATERDASWAPFIDTPMHPEYPCAHCTQGGSVGAVLRAELGSTPSPTLTSTSFLAKGMARSWSNVDSFVQEVQDGRVYDGVHYRNSTQIGSALGRQVGELAAARFELAPH